MAIDNSNRYFYTKCSFKFGFWSGLTAPTQYEGPVNFTKMEITGQTQEPVKLISNMEDSVGEALASVNKAKDPASLKCEFNSVTGDLLAMLLGADYSDLSQSSGAITDEAITPAVGIWVPLANKYISADGTGTEIVAKTSGDAVIAASHYDIDLINGLFKALDATGATVAKLSYHKATRTGEVYKAGKAKSNYVMLLGTGTEMVTTKRVRIQIHKASLAPSGAFDAVAVDYMKGALAGDLLTPTGYTSPWTFEYLDLAA